MGNKNLRINSDGFKTEQDEEFQKIRFINIFKIKIKSNIGVAHTFKSFWNSVEYGTELILLTFLIQFQLFDSVPLIALL